MKKKKLTLFYTLPQLFLVRLRHVHDILGVTIDYIRSLKKLNSTFNLNGKRN